VTHAAGAGQRDVVGARGAVSLVKIGVQVRVHVEALNVRCAVPVAADHVAHGRARPVARGGGNLGVCHAVGRRLVIQPLQLCNEGAGRAGPWVAHGSGIRVSPQPARVGVHGPRRVNHDVASDGVVAPAREVDPHGHVDKRVVSDRLSGQLLVQHDTHDHGGGAEGRRGAQAQAVEGVVAQNVAARRPRGAAVPGTVVGHLRQKVAEIIAHKDVIVARSRHC